MFGWFERRIDPYPMAEPTMPPATLFRFVLHYSRGAIPWLVLLASLHTSIARPYILFANRKDIRLLEITNNKARCVLRRL